MSKQQDKINKYGALGGQRTLDHGDGDSPPSYEETIASPSCSSSAKTVAVVGFILLQIVLITSILHQLITEKLNDSIVPEQVHLSLGQNVNEYYVSWATMNPADCYLVWHKNGTLMAQSIQGQMIEAIYDEDDGEGEDEKRLFVDKRTFSEKTYRKYFYNAKMLVTPGNSYYYYIASTRQKISSDHKNVKEVTYLSERYYFNANQYDDTNRTIKFIFYGDLGLKNAQSVPRLTGEALSYKHDLIIHNGDFAYDLNTDRGKYGDKFMKLIEPIAARVPYQVSVGNHEIARNFSHYDKRFKMINQGQINYGQENNFFYSFNAGPVHFIAISTEFYYFLDYVGLKPLDNQYEWLKADLAHASSRSERIKRPWIIVYGHRPMYCSSRDEDDCSKDSNLLRRGLPLTHTYALEKLFYNYGVDIELYSHEHQYERFLPIFDGKVYNGTDKLNDPYHNPMGPVHLISGSAGCQEKLDPFEGHPRIGSVKQIRDYGYTRIQATRCKVHLEQVSDDNEGTIVDEFTIRKNRQNFPPNSNGSESILYNDCNDID